MTSSHFHNKDPQTVIWFIPLSPLFQLPALDGKHTSDTCRLDSYPSAKTDWHLSSSRKQNALITRLAVKQQQVSVSCMTLIFLTASNSFVPFYKVRFYDVCFMKLESKQLKAQQVCS